jgi:L-histidine N-alpha-methyltransferase
MSTPAPAAVHLTDDDTAKALRADVLAGLSATPRTLSPKWLYDARGSDLFEQITQLPEYYPTRAERAVLDARAAEIAALAAPACLVELGSGSSEKTRLLLDAGTAAGTLRAFVPLDVSSSALTSAAAAITTDYPALAVHAVVGDFTQHLPLLPRPVNGPLLVAFLGGTIGNLLPAQRASFLADLRSVLAPGDHLLLGTDLVKDPAVLVPAYDDGAGVTAEFNRNLLRMLNRELGADFVPEAFEHVALWDADNEWIEMRLRSSRAQRVRVAELDLVVDFADQEDIHTEISAKFRRPGVQRELAAAGFTLRQWWVDNGDRFAVSLAEAT